jgi:hypothetical protein
MQMKKVLFSLVVMGLLATTLISCQSNQKGKVETDGDTTKGTTSVKPASVTLAKTGNPNLDVSPTEKVKTPQFSSEDVNASFAKFEPLKKEYIAAMASKDAEKIKEVTAQYNKWVNEASSLGKKLPASENQIYIDHYTKLVTQWDKLSVTMKK